MKKISVNFDSIANVFFESDDDNIIVKIYGYITNFDSVFPEYSNTEVLNSIYCMLHEKKCFFKIFDGEFVFVVKTKCENKYYICPNFYSSYPIYYYKSDDKICISNSITYIHNLVKHNEVVNIEALKMLISYGYLLGDVTPVTGIKKLTPGNDLFIHNDKLDFREYRNFNRTEEDMSYDEIYKILDDLFDKSIKKIFDFSKKNSGLDYTTLSGGLDSRMTFFSAKELGYDTGSLVTFGELGSLDVKIASKIAKDSNEPLIINSIDGGDYLSDTKSPILLNEGAALYSGAAHTLNTIKKLNTNSKTIIHTGQLGDAVLGSFSDTSLKEVTNDTLLLGAYNRNYIYKNLDLFKKYLEPYSTNEQFLFYNRAFNGANNGLNTIGKICCFSSPFMDRDFFDFCLKIPSKLMHGEKVYLDWINRKRSNYTDYVWEKWRMKPKSHYFKLANSKIYKYSKYKLFEVMLKQGMNPFQKWKLDNASLVGMMISKIYNFDDRVLLEEVLDSDVKSFISGASLIQLIQAVTVIEVCELYA